MRIVRSRFGFPFALSLGMMLLLPAFLGSTDSWLPGAELGLGSGIAYANGPDGGQEPADDSVGITIDRTPVVLTDAPDRLGFIWSLLQTLWSSLGS